MKKLTSILISLIMAAAFSYALHDMQTAQGIGYFFCLKTGGQRLIYDLITDLILILLFLLLCFIPYVTLKTNSKNPAHFILIYIGLMPFFNLNYFFSLIFNQSDLSRPDFTTRLGTLINSAKMPAILFILTLGFFLVVKKLRLKRTEYILLALSLTGMVLALFLPALSELLIFISLYLCLTVTYRLLEKAEFKSFLFYGFLCLLGLWNIYCVTSAWKL